MTKVLITGGSSLLGKYLAATKHEGSEIFTTWFTNHVMGAYHMDTGNRSQIAYIFERVKPEVVIHCAAVGSVDYTESHFTETREVNVIGTQNVLRASRDAGAKFIYISTNAVFQGDNPPYGEESPCQPANRYGSIKREAELLVMASLNWLVIRPFMLYGYPFPGGRSNWLITIMQNLTVGKASRLVNDTFWQLTYAEDVALAIWKLIEAGCRDEIFHVAAEEAMSLYDFGLRVAHHFDGDCKLIQPITSSELKGIAPRPKDTSFDLSKIHALGIKCRCVGEGLKGLR